ncbi:MAG: hypothetical protein R3A45_04060 [Bdellovibrionota bacterium]|nr:hypothetical protein [Deltaproteobacteria bacterium]
MQFSQQQDCVGKQVYKQGYNIWVYANQNNILTPDNIDVYLSKVKAQALTYDFVGIGQQMKKILQETMQE